MKIRIRYFASFHEITGQSEESWTLSDDATISDVRTQLLARYPRLQPIIERSLCAVNRGYVPADTALHDGDELVFIPPMGGGCLSINGTPTSIHGHPQEYLRWNH